MDFFEHQDQARRRTSLLVLLYALAVAGIVAALYLALLFLTGIDSSGATAQPVSAQAMEWWQPELFLWVALGVGLVVLGGTGFKTAQLSRGGEVVARSLGGHPIAPDTPDPDERKLLNIVEEMALASGISVPAVFLLGDEEGINAFAAGFTQRDAVIGVTRGCIRKLSRDELQGVIAHEFSHIVNGDMRLNIRLMGVLFGILMLTVVGRVLLRSVFFSGGRSRRSDKRGGNPLPFIGLALILVGYIGVFFASLIKSAVSRQREFLSDASAVQYTRNPAGIAGALKKIAGYGAKIKNPHATEASHLFFGEAFGTRFFQLFSTHPPLEKRIQRLDPAFNPTLAAMLAEGGSPAPGASGTGNQKSAVASLREPGERPLENAAGQFAGEAPSRADLSRGEYGQAGTGSVRQASDADFGGVDLDAGRRILESLPDELKSAAREPDRARGLVYAVLLSGSGEDPAPLSVLAATDSAGAAHAKVLFGPIAALPVELRLPLIEIAIPALGLQSSDAYKNFRENLRDIVAADQRIDLFEYAIEGMIQRHVAPFFEKPASVRVRYRRVEAVLEPCAVVLRALAVWGTSSPAAADECFEQGMRMFAPGAGMESSPREPGLEDVDRALRVLQASAPELKRKILNACRKCVLADGRVAPRQNELLRAIADALDVPMPPLPPPAGK